MTKEKETSVTKELEAYKKQQANILGPSISMEGLSEFHKVVIDSVTLSIDPANGDIYKHKDAYKDKPAQFIITGQGLQRLAVCAGIVWNPTETRMTSISQKYVAYNAVGCIRKMDGIPTCFQAEYDIDIDVEEDKIREAYAEKKTKWMSQKWFNDMGEAGQQAYVEAGIRKDVNFKKTHKTKQAASGAKNRVIRALLGVKKTYTLVELKKPFVMPRVILQPDYSDPEVKKMMLLASINAMTGVYGPTQSHVIEEPAIDIPPGDYATEAVSDDPSDAEEPTTNPAPKTPAPREKTVKKPDDKDGAEYKKMFTKIFIDLPEAEQELELTEMAQEKKYDLEGLPTPLDKMDAHNRIRFFEHLNSLPKPDLNIKPDIPF